MDLRSGETVFAVLGTNGVLHGCTVNLTYQGDGTASEPAARHTRAQRPGRARRCDGHVQFGTAHLVVVAQ